MQKFNDSKVALAWALFRAEKPENLRAPDPLAWEAFFLRGRRASCANARPKASK